VFAQIVDEQRNVVVGNLVTPLPITLDGGTHTVSRPLEAIAASLTPTGRYRLQVIGGSQVYGPVRGAAAITFSDIRLTLPTVGRAKACRTDRRFAVRLSRRVKSAKVWVAGQRVKLRRRHGRLRFVVHSTKQRVAVRIVAHRRDGHVVRQRRVYRFC
jgi:ABC-2 type transport system ATP-binding protein